MLNTILSVLLIIFSLLHALWGEKFLFNKLYLDTVSEEIGAVFRISWHQITFTLAACGLYFVLERAGMNFTGGQLVFVILTGNFIVYGIIAVLTKQIILLIKSIPLVIFAAVLLALLFKAVF